MAKTPTPKPGIHATKKEVKTHVSRIKKVLADLHNHHERKREESHRRLQKQVKKIDKTHKTHRKSNAGKHHMHAGNAEHNDRRTTMVEDALVRAGLIDPETLLSPMFPRNVEMQAPLQGEEAMAEPPEPTPTPDPAPLPEASAPGTDPEPPAPSDAASAPEGSEEPIAEEPEESDTAAKEAEIARLEEEKKLKKKELEAKKAKDDLAKKIHELDLAEEERKGALAEAARKRKEKELREPVRYVSPGTQRLPPWRATFHWIGIVLLILGVAALVVVGYNKLAAYNAKEQAHNNADSMHLPSSTTSSSPTTTTSSSPTSSTTTSSTTTSSPSTTTSSTPTPEPTPAEGKVTWIDGHSLQVTLGSGSTTTCANRGTGWSQNVDTGVQAATTYSFTDLNGGKLPDTVLVLERDPTCILTYANNNDRGQINSGFQIKGPAGTKVLVSWP